MIGLNIDRDGGKALDAADILSMVLSSSVGHYRMGSELPLTLLDPMLP